MSGSSVPSNMKLVTPAMMARWIVRICWATTESTCRGGEVAGEAPNARADVGLFASLLKRSKLPSAQKTSLKRKDMSWKKQAFTFPSPCTDQHKRSLQLSTTLDWSTNNKSWIRKTCENYCCCHVLARSIRAEARLERPARVVAAVCKYTLGV
jgi:hypothetical protein